MKNSIFSKKREAKPRVLSDLSDYVFKDITVVDDDNFCLEFGLMTLSPQYKVQLCKSGIQLPELLEDVFPDFILPDVMMPDMGGFETIMPEYEITRSKIPYPEHSSG